MIEFHGRPFLEYLVEELRDAGFKRVLLLLGYLPDVVQEHFGDGSRWGVSISYCVTAAGGPDGDPRPRRPSTRSTQRSCCCTATTTGRCSSTGCGTGSPSSSPPR